MNHNNNSNNKKLKYKIISCSSQQIEYPVSQLLFGGQNGGWQTKRFCTYPQQVTFQFYGPVKIDKIQIISDNRKIPSQVDILHFLPFNSNGNKVDQRFQKYGYLNFNKNQNTQFKEQKSIMVDIKCLYLRFLFHKPHHSKENFFSQVGIQQITIFGTDNNNFAPIQKLPRQIGNDNNYLNNQATSLDDDPFIYQKMSYLNSLKQKAVADEDFQQANFLKSMIDEVKKLGEQLKALQMQKRQAIQDQDYQKANNLKRSIEKHKQQIDSLISFQQDDAVIQQGQRKNNQSQIHNNNDVNNLNDFQDNQFVDPQMSQMIQKSGNFNKSGIKQSTGNSRVVNNSRVKLNRSIIKKQKITENYDQRVIPTLAAGNNKFKTQEQKPQDKQQEKKTELVPQQIDGKYIQFSLILQQHFSQDVVKSFFSQYWQLKVQALTSILEQIKKKPVADASFIKSLIVVVKNSISQTNFQVALNSLQVFGQLLKSNAKGNLVIRANQLTNDLDSISRQTVKKLSDNNNKIKFQAQKAFADMKTSSLYGPQNCVLILAKSKQKTKLSSKQILTRLTQLQKIVDSNGTSNQVINAAVDFGSQQLKNPAIQVRNQALTLLSLCKSKNSDQVQKKLRDQKNVLQLIQTAENKSNVKAEKGKKKK